MIDSTIENSQVMPFADDDAISLDFCEVHLIQHPSDQMCQLCMNEKIQAEYNKEVARRVADDLVEMMKDIGGGK